MAAPQGLAYFPGIVQLISANFVWSGGIEPSVCTFTIAPQNFLNTTPGTLQFKFGGVRLQFPDCVVDESTMTTDESGFLVEFQVKDRRWRWAFGEISGRYNMRKPDSKLDKSTEKSPQDLAKLLLKAMGETRYDVSALPNDPRPEVDWNAENPAQALEDMCEELGCRIVLTLANIVKIVVTGVGSGLPLLDSINDSYGISLQAIPDSVKIVGGRTKFNATWKLVPVGLDTNGMIRPIDDLSYAPKDWSKEDPDTFAGVTTGGGINPPQPNPAEPARPLPDEYARQCALQSVFRWYRISEMADGSASHDRDGDPLDLGKVPGYGLVQYLWQVLPIEDVQADTYTDNDELARSIPALIEGTYMRGGDPPMYQNTAPLTKWYAGFSIDREKGIVQLNEWAVKYDSATNTCQPAELYLTVSFGVKDQNTRADVRYVRERKLPGKPKGTGPQIVHAEEIADACLARYTTATSPTGPATFKVKEVVSTRGTLNDVDQFADKQLDALIAGMQSPQTAQRKYPGLLYLDLDGAIQQIQWEVADQGAFTTASLNTEFHAWTPSYKERRRQARAKKAHQNAKKILAKVGGFLSSILGRNKR